MFELRPNDEYRILEKLWCILSNENNADVAFWNRNGFSFVIADKSRFNSELCPLFFEECNLAYLLYFLKVCGFSIDIEAELGYEAWHTNFLRYQFVKIKEISLIGDFLQPEYFFCKTISDDEFIESLKTLSRVSNPILSQLNQTCPQGTTAAQNSVVNSSGPNMVAQHWGELSALSHTIQSNSSQQIVNVPVVNQTSTQVLPQTAWLHSDSEGSSLRTMNDQTLTNPPLSVLNFQHPQVPSELIEYNQLIASAQTEQLANLELGHSSTQPLGAQTENLRNSSVLTYNVLQQSEHPVHFQVLPQLPRSTAQIQT